MLIVNVKGGNIERALKELKGKFIKTNIAKECTNRKEYVKKSIIERQQVQKAQYIQNKKRNNE
jgi:small subunit ribosomal protein S21